jgi:tRNA-binding protein
VFEKARKPAYQLVIDFGQEIGIKKSSAQITHFYQPENLVGMQVIALVNLPPRQIADFMSECLVLGSVNQDGSVVLLQPQQAVVNGLKIA